LRPHGPGAYRRRDVDREDVHRCLGVMPGPPGDPDRTVCHTLPSAQICRGYAPIAAGGTSGGRTARPTTAHITRHVPLRPLGLGADLPARTPTGKTRTGVSA
jgi:hypothetical protein